MTGCARLRRLWLDVHLWIGVGLVALTSLVYGLRILQQRRRATLAA